MTAAELWRVALVWLARRGFDGVHVERFDDHVDVEAYPPGADTPLRCSLACSELGTVRAVAQRLKEGLQPPEVPS